jgi:hypothetical protein
VRRRALPVRRIERKPGDEAQVDFGSGAPIISPDGKRRKTYVFRIVLSHSRKGYSEATFTQTTDDFLRALENAFRQFGGVTKTLVIDNLKAAVAHPDWFDPELVPKVQSFCQHYGTVILPTKPYTPQHKGKVEAGIKYVKNNGLRGRTFTSLAEEQQHLHHWEATVADTRIHGTTKQQVGHVFEHVERAALIDRAFALRRAWRGHRLGGDDLAMQGLVLSCELEQVTSGRFTCAPNRRLAGHISKHAMEWFWFLIDPTIAATNHWAEQAIRPAVVNRKVWGGNRTWLDAQAQGILMSVIRTCGQRAIDPFAFLIDVVCRPQPQLILA